MKIISQTPVRIGLVGGGTDVEPFVSKYEGKVLSLAINLYHHAILIPNNKKEIIIKTLGKERRYKLENNLSSNRRKDFDLIYAVVNHFKPLIKSGFQLEIKFEGKSSGGLGSSASACVAALAVFNYWLKQRLGRNKIAYLAYYLETKVLGWHGGKQDQWAAAYGGINLFNFKANDKVQVVPLNFSPDFLQKLKKWLALFYIGGRRHSSRLQKKLIEGMKNKDNIKALLDIKKTVEKTLYALKKGDFSLVGQILDKAWQLKKKSNPQAVNRRINFLYKTALKNGALGGKIMGAGAGGHMCFFCPPQKREVLKKELEKNECQEIDYNFDFQGLKVWQENI